MSSPTDRVRAIAQILGRHPDAFVVLSNGLTSREAVHFIPQDRCLYLLHAMGEALAIGVGLADAQRELEVVVVEGDNNAAMGLAAWTLMPRKNIHYYVLANGIAETTGGQIVPPLPVVPEWCTVVPVNPGKAETPNPPAPAEIWEACQNWLDKRA
jgi:thiamine pyrophosphate-dependent acetolactate synthase large subunit-like protein